MVININEDLCEERGISVEDMLLILLARISKDIPVGVEILIRKGWMKKTNEGYAFTKECNDLVDSIMLDSSMSIAKQNSTDMLAADMQQIFPKGRKDGSNQYWRGNKNEIALRLKKFFKYYGNKWTRDEILEATRRYITSFNGDYKYMRVLKYFIWKMDRKQDEEGTQILCETSDLATLLENKEDIVEENDWTNELR